MKVETSYAGSIAVAEVDGRIDSANAKEFDEELSAIIGKGVSSLVIDCGGLSYISSAGLRVLLIAIRRTNEAGGGLALCAVPDHVREVLGCDVTFGAPQNRLYFPAKLLSHASPHAEPELLDLHERFASEQVARLEKKDIVGQVERIVAELLDSGEVTLDAVAERLGIKPRTLRTRLTEAETSFNQVLADFRYRLARQLLATTDESIDEIVYLTGFSEPSTFYRAFKRWSGMTPIEYRKTAQGKDAMVDAM